MLKRFAIVLLLAAPMYAADKPPDVPMGLQRDLMKAAANLSGAQVALENTPQYRALLAAQFAAAEIQKQWVKACGDDFIPQMDKDGNPGCAEKPVEQKKGGTK